MTILVFSDSHGDIEMMDKAVIHYRPDRIIHLGDYVSDARTLRERYNNTPIHIVRGNGDMLEPGKTEELLTLENHTMFITHGHKYHVKSGLSMVRQVGLNDGASVVLFGHTHIAYTKCVEGIWLFNPGSAARTGKPAAATCGRLIITPSEVQCEIIKLR